MMGTTNMKFPALPVNHAAFREIDTHQKAYIIGFLLADGCVLEACPGSYRARVNLKILAGDIQACRMAQEIVGGNLRMVEDGYRVIWEVNSDAIAADLIALGITPRKTFTASLQWDRIPDHLHGAVLAGLIDGDGHLRFRKESRNAEISISSGSVALRDQLLERFWWFKCEEVPPKGTRKNVLYKIIVESNRERLRSLLLNAYFPLPFPILARKQAVLDQIIGYVDDQDAYIGRMGEIPQLHRDGLTIEEIAAMVGTSLRPVLARLKAAGMTKTDLFTTADLDQMKQLHDGGSTILEIHASIGKGTEQAVRYRLQRLGCIVKQKPKTYVQHPMAQEIINLHGQGMTGEQIGLRLGITREMACKVLRAEGVLLRSGSPVKLTPSLIDWADVELAKGRTLKSVAEEIGVSGTLVRLRLKEKAGRLLRA